MKNIIIAIDGHSSCGKSTLAKDTAKSLSYKYIDSGAMYRAVTLYALQKGLIENKKIHETQLAADLKANKINITFKADSDTGKSVTVLNGVIVEDEIRKPIVNDFVSPIAVLAFVRTEMLRQQQELGKHGNVVMEGRDIGTAVFPNADLKIFLTADIETRAGRRYKEMQSKNIDTSIEDVKKNLTERDHIDSTRKMNPLRKADDAITIDNSNLNREEQMNKVIELVENI